MHTSFCGNWLSIGPTEDLNLRWSFEVLANCQHLCLVIITCRSTHLPFNHWWPS